jgi:hypothetical protein
MNCQFDARKLRQQNLKEVRNFVILLIAGKHLGLLVVYRTLNNKFVSL